MFRSRSRPEPYFFAGAGAEKLCYFRLRLQKIPYKWIFHNNLPKKQLKFPLSNNYSVQLAAVILPSNQKKNEKENFWNGGYEIVVYCLKIHLEPESEPEPFYFWRVGAGAGVAENRAAPQLWFLALETLHMLRDEHSTVRNMNCGNSL